MDRNNKIFLLWELTAFFYANYVSKFYFVKLAPTWWQCIHLYEGDPASCLVLVFGWLRKTKGANSAYPRVPKTIYVHYKIPDSWQYHKNATSLFHSHVQSTELRWQNHPVQHNKQDYRKEWIWMLSNIYLNCGRKIKSRKILALSTQLKHLRKESMEKNQAWTIFEPLKIGKNRLITFILMPFSSEFKT